MDEGLLAAPLWVRGPGMEPGPDATPLSLDALPNLLLAWLGLEALPLQVLPSPDGVRVAELHGPIAEDTLPSLRGRFMRSLRSFRQGEQVFVVASDGDHEAVQLDGTGAPVDLEALQAQAFAWTERATAPRGVQ